MYTAANTNRRLGPQIAWAATTAMTAALLAGCTTASAPTANVSASRAEAALVSGRHSQAIAHAEAAVLAEPRNAAYRAVLGSAYLDAGRFTSAATAFDDAMQLGDTSPRTVLSLALAMMGEGRHRDAAMLLNGREGEIATADLGLALALAGQTERGIHMMANAIRAGENTPKMRQNLAYAYALAGQWREARLMAAQDVPADKVSDRIAEWAEMARPEAWQHRVAALLQVPVGVRDAGQPLHLALANDPSIDQLMAEASELTADELPELAVAEDSAADRPLPSLTSVDPSAGMANASGGGFQTASAAPTQDAQRFVQSPVVQPTPARNAAAPAARSAAQSEGTHLVQLGSFTSEQGARRAWDIYVKNYPDLAGHQMVITEAVVRGTRYWRVSAAGFGASSSAAMCGRVKAAGGACIAWTESRPLPGAVDDGVRLAQR